MAHYLVPRSNNEQRDLQAQVSDLSLPISQKHLPLETIKVSHFIHPNLIIINLFFLIDIDLISKNRVRPGSPNTQTNATKASSQKQPSQGGMETQDAVPGAYKLRK